MDIQICVKSGERATPPARSAVTEDNVIVVVDGAVDRVHHRAPEDQILGTAPHNGPVEIENAQVFGSADGKCLVFRIDNLRPCRVEPVLPVNIKNDEHHEGERRSAAVLKPDIKNETIAGGVGVLVHGHADGAVGRRRAAGTDHLKIIDVPAAVVAQDARLKRVFERDAARAENGLRQLIDRWFPVQIAHVAVWVGKERHRIDIEIRLVF